MPFKNPIQFKYDRARHAGEKWRGEIDRPTERGWTKKGFCIVTRENSSKSCKLLALSVHNSLS